MYSQLAHNDHSGLHYGYKTRARVRIRQRIANDWFARTFPVPARGWDAFADVPTRRPTYYDPTRVAVAVIRILGGPATIAVNHRGYAVAQYRDHTRHFQRLHHTGPLSPRKPWRDLPFGTF